MAQKRPSISCFNSLIYHQNLSLKSRSLLLQIKKEARIYEKNDDQGKLWSQQNYYNGYTSYSSLDHLDLMSPTFADLAQQILLHAYNFSKELQYNTPKRSLFLKNIWINRMSAGASHSWHIHPQSFLSGTVYVDFPKNAAGIKFEDPKNSFLMHCPPQIENPKSENKRYIQIFPQSGDIVLFESYLRHEVPVNRAKNRLSVSFNIDWNPDL
jgi:uncharacterized protein (TIGR02466 family)